MPLENVPTDVLSRDLIDILTHGTRRLEFIVEAGVRRGLDPARVGTAQQKHGDASLRYRQEQRRQAIALLRDLHARVDEHARRAVTATYTATMRAVDAVVGDELNLTSGYGTIHVRAVEALASNMERSLHAAIDFVGGNIDDVFSRADAIEGALRNDRPHPGPIPFIGRRINDPYRKLALETVAQGFVGLETRRAVSRNLAQNLIREGVTDAVTGFIDRAGRRWPLDVYTSMVARTTTREATTRATINRMREGGLEIVTISSHPHKSDECDDYDGNTFALTSQAAAETGLDVLDILPPFHPNCIHVAIPGEGNLDAFERALSATSERAAAGAPPAPTPMQELEPHAPIDGLLPSTDPAQTPFVGHREPIYDQHTAERLEAQRIRELVDRDPGPEPGYYEALEAEARKHGDPNRDIRRTAYSDLTTTQKRARTAMLRDELGDSGLELLRTAAARSAGLEDAYVAGTLTRADLELELEDIWRERQQRQDRSAERERRAQFKRGSFPCFSCHRFKPRPSAICQYCGDDPVANVNYAGGLSHGGDYWQKAQAMDRAYNYDTALGAGYDDDDGRAYRPYER